MAIHIGRRKFTAMLSGAVVAAPLTARAQRPAMPVIGWLGSRSPAESARLVAAFRQALNETGYADGRNVAIEFHWAEGQYDRLPALLAELVRRKVAVIVTTGDPAALAARAAISSIPNVFVIGGDPVKLGLVASISRPGGNSTGVTLFTSALEAKKLGLVRELLPRATVLALLINPKSPPAETQLTDVQAAARAIGQQIHVVNASSEHDFDTAFTTVVNLRAAALLVGSVSFFNSRRDQLIELAARHALPTIYTLREFAEAGGLISYGTNFATGYQQAGVYTGEILKGEKPADLPVMQPTKFELVINLKTAKTLGLDVPANLLALADEVIE